MTNTGTAAHTLVTSKLGVHTGTVTVKSVRAARQTFAAMVKSGSADQAAVFAPGASLEPVAYFS